MKILIVNTSERTGGAAVAANRLLKALRKQGVEAAFLVRDRSSRAAEVYAVDRGSWLEKQKNRWRFLWERLIIFCCNKGKRKNLFQVSIANTGTDISRHPLVQEADVIHLHWINQGFLSLDDIQALIDTGKPVVWTLHDLWPATAICHYPGTCEKFELECYHCPKLVDRPLWDLARAVFRQKQSLALAKVAFVGCSRWITEQAQRSALLRQAAFHSIPNPIDRDVFQPIDRAQARESFALPVHKCLILFAAAKLSDDRKGANYLLEACRILKETTTLPIEVVLMGSGSDELINAFSFPVNELGYISEDRKKVMAYAGANLFVSPSLEDNLPNTIMEAMACGTPCVGFDTGGIPEMIDHQANGYVARYKDPKDLAAGILWVLENREAKTLSSACLEKVERSYSEAVVAGRYMNLYEALLKKKL
ncbi:glycosyltransferase family 4 protein [Parabacteroides sp. PF5-6]|uniref:glycosyltransferase family 4 protein n=1 Tax=Parabacteroides sp. PF5-6 TaxID=1742403 RepID=UPI00240654A7|nr:glycosyltransferase family 4 protein [Parabacteroides sp. PF5-6]MDF9830956.1 glycosyltransferase involved in cell wall biosynthesis [Parabacteroides sp. PF5-6]